MLAQRRCEYLPPLLQHISTQFSHGIKLFLVPRFDIGLLPLLHEFLFLEVEQGVHRRNSKFDAVDGESAWIIEHVNALRVGFSKDEPQFLTSFYIVIQQRYVEFALRERRMFAENIVDARD
jgi:hypothetical protein